MRWIACAALLTVWAAGLRAEDAAKPDASEIPALIEKLKADDGETRDQARKNLALLGEPARAKLREALKGASKDADFQAQLRETLRDLEKQTILGRYEAPKTIDLELKDATVKDALERLKAHYGWVVKSTDEAGARKVSVAVKGARYFEVLEAIRTAGKLDYAMVEEAMMMGAAQGSKEPLLPLSLKESDGKGLACVGVSGPFILVLQSIRLTSTRTLQAGQAAVPERRQLGMQGQIISEPGLKVSSLEVADLSATDAKGAVVALQDQGTGGTQNDTKEGSECFYFSAHALLAEMPQAPLGLKANLKVQVPLKSVTQRINDLSAVINKPIELKGGGTITVEKVEKEDRGWKVNYKTKGDANAFADVVGMRHMAAMGGVANEPPEDKNGLFFLDAEGHLVPHGGMGASGDGTSFDVRVKGMPREPKAMLIRWTDEKAERKFSLEMKGIPVP